MSLKKQCPCCGAEVDKIPLDSLIYMCGGKQSNALISTLVENYPRHATFEYLIDRLYGHDIGGGPDDPLVTMRVIQARINKRLKPDWKIKGVWGIGLRLVPGDFK